MDLFTRRIIGFDVERADIDGVSVCRMFDRAVSDQPLPKHISTDHDPLFRFHRWLANLRVLEIDEIKSVPYVPVSHPFVERLIGTIRREYLDHIFFWNAVDLAQKLEEFRDYYNADRVHRAHAGATPAQRAGAPCPAPASLDHYACRQHCRGSPGAGRGITTNAPLTGPIFTRAKRVELPCRLDRPRLLTATRDLRRDRLVAVALQLRGLATCVVFRDLGMTHHPLEVLDQQRRYAVHEVLRNVVEHAGLEPADQHEDLEIRHG